MRKTTGKMRAPAAKPATQKRKQGTAPDEPAIERISPPGRSAFHELFPEEQAAELAIRAELLVALRGWLAGAAPTQARAAATLGITQARVSDLKRGKIDRFSLDQLIRLAARAGLKPRITLAAVPAAPGLLRGIATDIPREADRV